MDAIEEMITNPTVAMGLGGLRRPRRANHGRQLPYLAAQLLGEGARPLMTFEEAIRGWTSDTAAIFGIKGSRDIARRCLRRHQRH